MNQAIIQAMKGGALLALATSISFVLAGRVLGMSSVLGGIVTAKSITAEFMNKLAILGGLLIASGVAYLYTDHSSSFTQTINEPAFTYLVAGFLVGVGTRLGGGCTSGHGLCGLPRFSVRSIVAVLAFLSTAVLTATFKLKNYLPHFAMGILEHPIFPNLSYETIAKICIGAGIVLFLISCNPPLPTAQYILIQVILVISGFIFGFGLLISGMTRRDKVNGFLDLSLMEKGSWDPSLFAVLMTGVGINLITFNLSIRVIKATFGGKPPDYHGNVDLNLVLGAMIFGLGWGIGSMCPGPVYALSAVFEFKVQGLWLIGCSLGMLMVHLGQQKAKTS